MVVNAKNTRHIIKRNAQTLPEKGRPYVNARVVIATPSNVLSIAGM